MGGNDSVALARGRADGHVFRHLYAHEFAHVMQRKYGKQLAVTWCGTAPVKDKQTYGYKKPVEQQAEALSYAFRYLQQIQQKSLEPNETLYMDDPAELESTMPGTLRMAALLLTHPAMAGHVLNKDRQARAKAKIPVVDFHAWTWNVTEISTAKTREENVQALVNAGNKPQNCRKAR